ncbi:MAG TPA: hypothetical protein VIE64_00475 [Solirubrobacterales bacterium]|jgi:hypothetical protein
MNWSKLQRKSKRAPRRLLGILLGLPLNLYRLLFGVRFGRIHFEALCVLEQAGAEQLDRLASLLGIPLSRTRRVVDACVKLGLMREKQVLPDERQWLWLSRAGYLVVGLDPRAFSSWRSLRAPCGSSCHGSFLCRHDGSQEKSPPIRLFCEDMASIGDGPEWLSEDDLSNR